MNKAFRITCAAIAGVLATGAFAQRAPTVDYTVTGSAGNWTLDFNVQNNFLNGEGNVYFFGVLLDTGLNLVGSPSGWNEWSNGALWNNAPYGGSNTNYNNNWITGTGIAPGSSQSGFQAVSTDASAPTQVQFFAFADGGTYGGNDNFNTQGNPGFEGISQIVPEPASLAVLALGVLPLMRRRKKN